jgi:hypothetical protein
MAVVNKILGVKATNTTAYRPRTNGQVERFNSTLCTAITHYAATQNSWDLELATSIYAYNRTPNEATGYAPFELVLSRAPAALEISADWDFIDIVPTSSPTEFRNALLRHVSKIADKIRESLSSRRKQYIRGCVIRMSELDRQNLQSVTQSPFVRMSLNLADLQNWNSLLQDLMLSPRRRIFMLLSEREIDL